MVDRRRTPRYLLDTPLPADAMPMQDVMVELFSGDRLVVVSLTPHAPHETLMIHMTTAGGHASRRARVVSSSPTSIGGTLCYRLELCVAKDTDRPPEREQHH